MLHSRGPNWQPIHHEYGGETSSHWLWVFSSQSGNNITGDAMTFGVLTLATTDDYRKAIGLALSVRVSNPGIPIAVACSPRARPFLEPYFDQVVDKDPALHGYVHKIHLDRYSPFDETFYFDSDVLVFRPLQEVLDSWRGQPFAACGNYVTTGISPFGLDRTRVLKLI